MTFPKSRYKMGPSGHPGQRETAASFFQREPFLPLGAAFCYREAGCDGSQKGKGGACLPFRFVEEGASSCYSAVRTVWAQATAATILMKSSTTNGAQHTAKAVARSTFASAMYWMQPHA